jgi:hypothetical protein
MHRILRFHYMDGETWLPRIGGVSAILLTTVALAGIWG